MRHQNSVLSAAVRDFLRVLLDVRRPLPEIDLDPSSCYILFFLLTIILLNLTRLTDRRAAYGFYISVMSRTSSRTTHVLQIKITITMHVHNYKGLELWQTDKAEKIIECGGIEESFATSRLKKALHCLQQCRLVSAADTSFDFRVEHREVRF